MGIAVAVMLLPVLPFLLKRTQGQDGLGLESLANHDTLQRQWTRDEMLRDKRFFKIAPLVMTMSAVFTGIIFHQKFIIATAKEWDFLWWSFCFVGFAVCQVAGSFTAGWLVDRVSAKRITPFVLVPFAFSLLLLGLAENEFWAPVIMGTMGLSAGATHPTYSSLWAELYGTQHLGAIRAAGAVLMVFASALGPVIVGWALDTDISVFTITMVCVFITLSTSCLSAFGLRNA